MSQCAKCSLELRPLANLPGLRRVSYPHVCKQMPKLGPAFSQFGTDRWGVGTDWMPHAYGEYYSKSPAVFAAVKLRADSIMSAPLRTYRVSPTGDKEEVEATHPLATLLAKVNPFWTAGDLLRMTSVNLDLWGSAFWVLKKDGPTAPPTEIWQLRPDNMHIIPSQTQFIEGYWYQTIKSQRILLRPDEVIWFHYFNPLDPYGGLSPIAASRLSIDMGNEAIKHNRNVFRNGMLWGNIALVGKDNATLSEDQVRELREGIKQRYAGTDNSNIPLILQNMDAKNLGLNNRDLEFMASLRWSLEDVCRVFFIPKPMLGDLEKATYDNIDAAERIFWRSAMVPHLAFIEERINEFLVPEFGDDSLLVEFDTTNIEALQDDANEVAAREQKDVAAGIMTINEVRAGRGLDAVPWGDVAWMPLGVQPVENPEDAQPPFNPMAPGDEPAAEEPAKRLPVSGRMLDGAWRKYQDPHMSDTFLGKILELHGRGLTRSENEFRRMQSALFDAQRREVQRRIGLQKDIGGLEVKALPQLGVFSLGDWVKRYMRAGLPLYAATALLGANQQSSAFSLGVAFDMRKIQPWLERRVEFWAQRVNEETARLLIAELEEGIASGESVRKLQDRVEQVFDFSDVVRSERIARTETQAALNEGAVEAYRQSGVVERKMWLATLDARTRDAHIEAHRQVVELEANFLVGGEAISHPGEGSPENAINCRCAVAPVVSTRALRLPALHLGQ